MPLASGTTLGPYTIEAPLGVGGMGEVYKARDTRLDRTVAIKVLPEHVAADPDLKQRFEREAKTVAALSHPHICPVFDVGEQDGVNFLVMEHLEGETLAQRLEKGALPLDQALTIAIEISDALDKAHRQGIVHRDLKPGNIMLTKAGAKLLDFGLAKPTAMAMGADSAMPTMSEGLTGQGAILGTLQYMAPEQLEGEDVDARTDIFAFGTVVYEMITGTKTFSGKSQASMIAAILEREPTPISDLQPVSPAALDRVVKKCLAKDPERRWHNAHDLHDELKWIAEGDPQPDTLPAGVAAPPRPGWRQALPLALASSAVAVIITGLTMWTLRPAPVPTSPALFVLSASPSPAPVPLTRRTELAISPDGQVVIYRAVVDGEDGLYVRHLDRLEAERLVSEPAGSVFMSPDGAWVGFFTPSDETLKKVQVSGGPALTLCPMLVPPRGASWGPDDTIVFAADAGGLFRVPAAGGEPEALTMPELPERHYWPEVLPSGRAVLFTIVRVADGETGERSDLAVLDLSTGEQRVLLQGGTHPQYLSSGHLVYSVANTLRAVRFDADRLEVVSDPIPVVEGVRSPLDGGANVDVSDTGTLVYQRGDNVEVGTRTLVWVDRAGLEEPLAAEPRRYGAVRVSPDGGRAAVVVAGQDENPDLMVYDLARNIPTRLTFDPAADNYPVWTPDGERVVFASQRDGPNTLYWQAADGTGEVERLGTDATPQLPSSWSPDGATLLIAEQHPDTQWDTAVLSMDDERASDLLIQTEFQDFYPELSPDGRWLAYASTESGRQEIYVRPFPDVNGGKWQISRDSGTFPVWGPDGRELFYLQTPPNVAMMVVPVETEPTFTPGNPEVLFNASAFLLQPGPRLFDIAPDGQRFLWAREGATPVDETPTPPDIIVVENWLDELQRLLPTP